MAIVTGDKDFFQLVGDGIRVFNPRDEGTWYDADRREGEVRRRPDQVVDVLALMGDTIDNVKGVPGIGEKGARELITTYGTARRAARARRRGARQALSRGAARASRDEARSSRELLASTPTCRLRSTSRRSATAARRARRATTLFAELGFRALTMEFAPTADSVAKDYRLVTDADGAAIAGRRAAGARVALRCRAAADGPAAMRAGIVGIAVSTARAGRPLHPDAACGHACTGRS